MNHDEITRTLGSAELRMFLFVLADKEHFRALTEGELSDRIAAKKELERRNEPEI